MKKVIEFSVKGKEWEEAQNQAFEKLNKNAKLLREKIKRSKILCPTF